MWLYFFMTNVFDLKEYQDIRTLREFLPRLNSAFYQSGQCLLSVAELTKLFSAAGIAIPETVVQESNATTIGLNEQRLLYLRNVIQKKLGIAA